MARHVSTRLDTFVMWCILAVSSLSSSTSRHTRHDERDRCDSKLSLLCNLYEVSMCKLFTNLLKYTCIYLIYSIWRIKWDLCVWERKTTKLVQASTTACSPSAVLEQHGSTRSSRLAQHVERVDSCRDVAWRAKWNLGLSEYIARRASRYWGRNRAVHYGICGRFRSPAGL